LDEFSFHGRIEPETPIDPTTEKVGVLITNEFGVIYRGELEPGVFEGRGGSARPWRFVDRKNAKKGLSQTGIARISIYQYRATNLFVVNVHAYGDMSIATVPNMTLQFTVGDDSFQNTGTWKQTGYGWRLDFPRLGPRNR
jgi:hypothetical protein